MIHAVIDRIEGALAILVFDDGQELEVPRKLLPTSAKEGHHLSLTTEEGRPTDIEIDQAATAEARRRIEEKLNSLRRGDHLIKDE